MASIRNACWAFARFSGHVPRKPQWRTSAGRAYPNLNQGEGKGATGKYLGCPLSRRVDVCATHTHTHTHNRLTAFVRDYPGRPVPEKRTTSLQVLFGLPLGLGPSTSYSIHFFTQSSSFRNTCPYQRSLLCCNTNHRRKLVKISGGLEARG